MRKRDRPRERDEPKVVVVGLLMGFDGDGGENVNITFIGASDNLYQLHDIPIDCRSEGISTLSAKELGFPGKDHLFRQSYLYGDWMLVEFLPKQPNIQIGEPSRSRTTSRGISSEDNAFKSKAHASSNSDKIPFDRPKYPVSEDVGARNALQVTMHISPEINAAFYNNIHLGLDLVRPYTNPNRTKVPNSGRLFADLLAHAQQMLVEPILDNPYQVIPANNTYNQNTMVISEDSSGSVRVAPKKWDGKLSEDPWMGHSKKIRVDCDMKDMNAEAGEHSLLRQ
ncbi:hypothetical protein Scep_019799 [Stephania cephalantha]|uniref:Uncharacterized protein n=1 Tax=Stephania cephalantha TaxID=152367 RepID=A0AAP0IBK5_9MAGN